MQGGSDSEQESIEGVGTPWKPQKHERVKFQTEVSKRFGHIPDSSQSPPMASSNDCLSLLNNRRSGGK